MITKKSHWMINFWHSNSGTDVSISIKQINIEYKEASIKLFKDAMCTSISENTIHASEKVLSTQHFKMAQRVFKILASHICLFFYTVRSHLVIPQKQNEQVCFPSVKVQPSVSSKNYLKLFVLWLCIFTLGM